MKKIVTVVRVKKQQPQQGEGSQLRLMPWHPSKLSPYRRHTTSIYTHNTTTQRERRTRTTTIGSNHILILSGGGGAVIFLRRFRVTFGSWPRCASDEAGFSNVVENRLPSLAVTAVHPNFWQGKSRTHGTKPRKKADEGETNKNNKKKEPK